NRLTLSLNPIDSQNTAIALTILPPTPADIETGDKLSATALAYELERQLGDPDSLINVLPESTSLAGTSSVSLGAPAPASQALTFGLVGICVVVLIVL